MGETKDSRSRWIQMSRTRSSGRDGLHSAQRNLGDVMSQDSHLIVFVCPQFESQDILVPWRTPDRSSSEEKAEVGGNEHESITTTTTTTTSDEDVTHYHAYTQTSESDSCYSCSKCVHCSG